MATQNEYGVWEPTRYDEESAEFNSVIPDWELRLAEHDMREQGDLVPEHDMETDPYGHGYPTENDWGFYLEAIYCDPMEG